MSHLRLKSVTVVYVEQYISAPWFVLVLGLKNKTYLGPKGYAVAQVVEEQPYKPEGRGCDFRWSYLNFSLT